MKNKKGLISIISLFMCVALVSIGFAAWVITGGAESTSEGNFGVTEVVDARIGIDNLHFVNVKTGEDDVQAPKDIKFLGSRAAEGDDWLKVEEGENLSVRLKGTITSKSEAHVNKTPVVTLAVLTAGNDDASATFTALQAFDDPAPEIQTSELIKALPTQGNGITVVVGDDTDDSTGYSAVIDITITFAWGTAFDGTNPQLYYNDKVKTSKTHGDEAIARLNAIYTLNTLKYKLTVDVTNQE